jgi:hypothetical protein
VSNLKFEHYPGVWPAFLVRADVDRLKACPEAWEIVTTAQKVIDLMNASAATYRNGTEEVQRALAEAYLLPIRILLREVQVREGMPR